MELIKTKLEQLIALCQATDRLLDDTEALEKYLVECGSHDWTSRWDWQDADKEDQSNETGN